MSGEKQTLSVSLLNDSFPPTIDGVANAVVNYATQLQCAGDSVQVATPAYPDVTDDYPFEVVRYPSLDLTGEVGYRAGTPFSPDALWAMEGHKPDVIHSHCPVMSTILARMLRERVHAPIVFTYHTKFDIDIKKSVKGKLLQDASIHALVNNISACDEVWTVSHGAGENLRSLGYEGEYIVMENGVDFPRGAATAEDIAAARAEFGIPTGKPVFLFVGRMMWYKGIRLSLDGLRAAKEAGEDFCFVMVGSGMDRDEIERYVTEVGLEERCIFTGAVRDREKLRAIFGCADLFLFPSTFDTNGIVVREAAACYCPSLLIRNSCAAEGIEDGDTGLLINETVQDMAGRIIWACHHTQELRGIGRNAAEKIYLSWEDAVARARDRYAIVAENYRAGKLVHATVPGDDFYASAAVFLSTVGRRNDIARENREAAQAALTERYNNYMGYLQGYKNKLSQQLDGSKSDWTTLMSNLKNLWNEQMLTTHTTQPHKEKKIAEKKKSTGQ